MATKKTSKTKSGRVTRSARGSASAQQHAQAPSSQMPLLVGLLIVISVLLGAVIVTVSQKMSEVKLIESQTDADEAYVDTLNTSKKYDMDKMMEDKDEDVQGGKMMYK